MWAIATSRQRFEIATQTLANAMRRLAKRTQKLWVVTGALKGIAASNGLIVQYLEPTTIVTGGQQTAMVFWQAVVAMLTKQPLREWLSFSSGIDVITSDFAAATDLTSPRVNPSQGANTERKR